MTAATEWYWQTTPVAPTPTSAQALRRHLLTDHRLTPGVVDDHEPEDWENWHRAEHRTRHPNGNDTSTHSGHLRHTHPEYQPKAHQAETREAA